MAEIEHVSRNIKILVVDDHAATRDLVRAILRSLGFAEIAQADNGRTAIDYLEQNTVDLVICDWNMPFVSGLEVLKTLRSYAHYQKVPFIMLTAEAYRDSLAAAVEAGVSDYIAKPFTAETLINKISAVFKRK